MFSAVGMPRATRQAAAARLMEGGFASLAVTSGREETAERRVPWSFNPSLHFSTSSGRRGEHMS